MKFEYVFTLRALNLIPEAKMLQFMLPADMAGSDFAIYYLKYDYNI